MRICNKKGFTLAEVMLAMAILGVVAMMTIPGLANNYKNRVFAVQAKKNLTTLESLFTSAQVDTFASTLSKTGLVGRKLDEINKKINNYLDTDYNASNATAFAPSYRSVDATSSSEFECEDGTVVVLKSGAALCYIPDGNSATVIIDSNGLEPPNMGGKDIFTYKVDNNFNITDDGEDCTSSEIGEGCLKRLMDNDWKINY